MRIHSASNRRGLVEVREVREPTAFRRGIVRGGPMAAFIKKLAPVTAQTAGLLPINGTGQVWR
jgi:hypothetical protein